MLLACLHGPFEGKTHDAGVFAQSGLRDQWQQRMNLPSGTFCLYGEALSPYLQKGFQGNLLTPEQQALHTTMSKVRQSAEWTFGEISTIWAYVVKRIQQKIGLQPVGLYYRAAVLLNNCRVCLLRGNETSDYFQVGPPLFREYLL